MLTCKEYTDLSKIELKEYIKETGLKPKLVVIQVGDRPESNSYIRGKMLDCEEVGIECVVKKHPDNISEERLIERIKEVNRDKSVHGLIVQLPLPDHINAKNVTSWVREDKDVDGFVVDSPFDPCTPSGVIGYLKHIGYEFEGKDALVIGRSPIVGKPLADMLTDLNCTVTLAHSKTRRIDGHVAFADVIFTCIDKIEYFEDELDFPVSPDTDVIDVGLGAGEDGKLHGNIKQSYVEYIKNLQFNDKFIISGTGGVGLLTRLSLLENVVKACEMQTPHPFLTKKFCVSGEESC